MTDAIDLTTEQRKTLNDLLRRFLPGVAVWAYGSRVKWTAHPNSDLDLVAFTVPEQRAQVADLKDALAESNLSFPVDLHVWDEEPERFREIIRKEYVVVQAARQQPAMAMESLVGSIPAGWEHTTLGVACKRGGGDIQTGPFGSQLHAAEYVPVGIPSIMPQNIGDNLIIEDGIARITPEDAKRLSRYLVRKGDIVYSRRGDVERRALVRDKEDGWLCGTGCLRVRLGDQGPDSQFATYYLGHPGVREWIARHAHGATMPNLNTSILGACPFVVPPLSEQRAIAHILGTLDDKIELNRKMNETLEAMARALFRSWFVDFDPVRAKAEGRDTGLPIHLADLFPDSFEVSELGEIPKGWGVERVRDIGTIVCGKTPPTQVSEYYGHDVPFITIPDMHGRIFATSVQRRLSHVGAQSQEKKLLPAGTICVSCIATAGLVIITSELSQTNQQINSVVPNQRDATYFWYWTLRGLGDEIRAGGSGGSVLTNLSTGRFGELQVLGSVAELRSFYHTIAAPVFGRILENEHESRTLAALRDTLLPKLMSGEIRVNEEGEIVEAAS